jgi:hypothetical protein
MSMHFVFEKGIVKLVVVSQAQFVGFTDMMTSTTQLGGNEKGSSSFDASLFGNLFGLRGRESHVFLCFFTCSS